MLLENLAQAVAELPGRRIFGRVTGIQGILVEIGGIEKSVGIGGRCFLRRADGSGIACEVVGFRDGRTLAMPLGGLIGVGLNCRAEVSNAEPAIYPCAAWLGRVIDGHGRPIDGKGPLPQGTQPYALRAAPPPAHLRRRVQGKVDLGVRALNGFLTCCRGQRMGIFAGSGVGKSVLLSMIARGTQSDCSVIGLIGERGREVQEFLEDDLGPEGLARSVVVVATSDQPALVRRQAAYVTMAICEYFRDRGEDVLCLMDSVTRFAMAQREIGLSAGEPPTSKGYPPTVFGELPRLLERAGPGVAGGSVTGLFTVLVEGDDHNEPVADAVRSILDGHVVLDRTIAERGRFPAIDVLRSVSRTMPGCNSDEENRLVQLGRGMIALYEGMAELIRIGAYKRGSDPSVDRAIDYYPKIEAFLAQRPKEAAELEDGYRRLAEALAGAEA